MKSNLSDKDLSIILASQPKLFDKDPSSYEKHCFERLIEISANKDPNTVINEYVYQPSLYTLQTVLGALTYFTSEEINDKQKSILKDYIDVSRCNLCGHCNIHHKHIIKNILNDSYILVGGDCIGNYVGILEDGVRISKKGSEITKKVVIQNWISKLPEYLQIQAENLFLKRKLKFSRRMEEIMEYCIFNNIEIPKLDLLVAKDYWINMSQHHADYSHIFREYVYQREKTIRYFLDKKFIFINVEKYNKGWTISSFDISINGGYNTITNNEQYKQLNLGQYNVDAVLRKYRERKGK